VTRLEDKVYCQGRAFWNHGFVDWKLLVPKTVEDIIEKTNMGNIKLKIIDLNESVYMESKFSINVKSCSGDNSLKE
jgi:hypothetical protein